jgi:hypothetical protein
MKTMRACTFIQFGEEAIHIPKCCGRTEEQAKSYYKNRDMKYTKPLLLLLCHLLCFRLQPHPHARLIAAAT